MVVVIVAVAIGVTQCSSCDANESTTPANTTSSSTTAQPQTQQSSATTWTLDQVTASNAQKCLLIKDGEQFIPLLSKDYPVSKKNISITSQDFLKEYSPDAYERAVEENRAFWEAWVDGGNPEPEGMEDGITELGSEIDTVWRETIGSSLYYSEDNVIPVVEREKGQQIVTNSDRSISLRKLPEKSVYVWGGTDAMDFRVPLEINGVEVEDQSEAYSALADIGVYLLGSNTWVSFEPAEFALGTWKGTALSETNATIDRMAWIPVPAKPLWERVASGEADNSDDAVIEKTKDGYFIVQTDGLPAGYYLAEGIGSFIIEIR